MKKINNIPNFLFYILLILLPFNARYIFNFQQISNTESFREHLTWSIYLFDIIFVTLLIVYGFILLRNLLSNKLLNKKSPIKNFLFYFILLILLSCFFAINQKIAFHSSAYLIGAILLFLIAKKILQDKKVFTNSALIIFLSGTLQALIAIFQFVSQKSIGLYLLGESHLSSQILGVAKFEIAGEKFIRAYGTFPHANLLGAFLVFSLLCGLWLIHYSPNYKNNKLFLLLGNLVILTGTFLTFSRSIWLVASLIILSLLLFYRKKITQFFSKLSLPKKSLAGGLLVVGVFFVCFSAFPRLHLTNCLNDQSYNLRKVYNQAAFQIIHTHPFLGVGPGNFTLALKNIETEYSPSLQIWEIQPVHNLYLLIASEVGLIGLIIFLIFIFMLISPKNITLKNYNSFLYLILAFLILGFFDHYFWTLPQGQMLFWLSLAFFINSQKIETSQSS